MNMIVAVDKNWGIGAKGDLLCNIPEDMKFFRETTQNSVVIMGRKTLLSFPAGKPLKNRVNIVISTNESFNPEGCIMARTIEEAVEIYEKNYSNMPVFVIGGGVIYKEMLKYCNKAFITKIDKEFEEADTFIYNLDEFSEWEIIQSSEVKECEGINFKFVTYEKK